MAVQRDLRSCCVGTFGCRSSFSLPSQRSWHRPVATVREKSTGQPQQAHRDADAKGPRNVGLDRQGSLGQGDGRRVAFEIATGLEDLVACKARAPVAGWTSRRQGLCGWSREIGRPIDRRLEYVLSAGKPPDCRARHWSQRPTRGHDVPRRRPISPPVVATTRKSRG